MEHEIIFLVRAGDLLNFEFMHRDEPECVDESRNDSVEDPEPSADKWAYIAAG